MEAARRLRILLALVGLFLAGSLADAGPERRSEPDRMVFVGITPIAVSATLY